MMMNKSVLLDTSFLISLVDTERTNHQNAKDYFKYFLDENYKLYLSTIVASEFLCKGSIEDLPHEQLRVLPFNFSHAERLPFLFSELKTSDITRIQVKDDYKIACQAQHHEIGYFITDDKPIYDKLEKFKNNLVISFIPIYLGIDYRKTFQLQTDFLKELE